MVWSSHLACNHDNSDRIRALLNSKGVQYKEIDVTSVAGAKDEMEKRTNGRRTVPQVHDMPVLHGPESTLVRACI
jgi:glutaredoxin